MDDQIFIRALTNFTRNFAYGDAIRHLVDKGYTTEKIIRDYQYPLPQDTIETIVKDHMIDLVSEHFQRCQEDRAFIAQIEDETEEIWVRTQEPEIPLVMDLIRKKRNLVSQNGNKLTALWIPIESGIKQVQTNIVDQVHKYRNHI